MFTFKGGNYFVRINNKHKENKIVTSKDFNEGSNNVKMQK